MGTLITRGNVRVVVTGQWSSYKKIGLTVMARVQGVFVCETKEGRVVCEDGFVAIDAEGYPYPIAASIQEKSYELVGPRFERTRYGNDGALYEVSDDGVTWSER